MGQILVRQLDDAAIERLKTRAREKGTSVEALVREVIHKAAELTTAEKMTLIEQMQVVGRRVLRPDAKQIQGWELIREDRDHGH